MTTPPATTLTLYFVADSPDPYCDRDLFVWASSLVDAIRYWREFYETKDVPDGVTAVPLDNPAPGTIDWDRMPTLLLT